MLQIVIALGTLRFFGLAFPLRIFGYGLMLVLGFLTAILLAQWRARRSGEDPTVISQFSILALIGGVGGARLGYIIENWRHFRSSGFWEVLNISSGGLIYFGGLLVGTALVIGYLLLKRLPVRRFLDIVAPSLMIGLAFGRAGCLLNGCCWGGPCRADWPLETRFPMISRPLLNLTGSGPYVSGQSLSPAYDHQYWSGQVTPDDRLLNAFAALRARIGCEIERKSPLPVEELHGRLGNDQLATMLSEPAEARKLFEVLAGEDGRVNRAEWNRGRSAGDGFLRGSEMWSEAVEFAPAEPFGEDSLGFEEAWRYVQARKNLLMRRYDLVSPAGRQAANEYLQADLYDLLSRERTLSFRPAQLLGIANAVLLALLLTAFYRHRRREGRVFALMLILYPITRFLLESIRNADPLNVLHGHWTHNQVSGIFLIAAGLGLWWWIGRRPASAGPTWNARLDAAGAARGAKVELRT